MLRSWQLPFVASALAMLGVDHARCFSAAAPEDLLGIVTASHRASRESIQTCSCRVELTIAIANEGNAQSPSQSCSSQYWYSPDAIRAKVKEGGVESDFLFSNFVRQGVIRRIINGQASMTGTRDRFVGTQRSRCDAWVRALFLLNVPGSTEFVPFEEMVRRATKVESATRRSIKGTDVAVIKLSFERENSKAHKTLWNVDLEFDSSRNYLVRNAEYYTSWYRRREEVTQFAEVAPGLYFPECVVGSSENNGKPFGDTKCVFSDVRINSKLPPDVFVLRYPHGIPVADTIRGTEYRVNTEGRPISKETPLGRAQPPPTSESQSTPAKLDTQVEQSSLFRWVLPLSLGLLGIVGTVAVLRLRRSGVYKGKYTSP